MATFLDVSGLEPFAKIFVFILVLVAIYVVVAQSKFGGTKWIAWIIAIVVAIFVILSDLATGLVQFIAPAVAILFLFLMFALTAAKIFGGTLADFEDYKWVLYLVIIIIFVVGGAMYIREKTNVPGDVDEQGNEIKESNYVKTSNFFFHPKVLGIIFTLLVAVFTVALLAGKSS